MDLEKIKKTVEDESVTFNVAELFKVLGDNTRVKILTVLEQSALCVNDICECVNMTKSAVSHQLRILRQAKLVRSMKNGKEVIYSLDDEHVFKIFDCALAHILEK